MLLLLGGSYLLDGTEEGVEGVFHVGGDMLVIGEGEAQFEGLVTKLGAGGGEVAMTGGRRFEGGRGRYQAGGVVENAGEALKGHQGAGPLLLEFVEGGVGSGKTRQGKEVEQDQEEGQETGDQGQAEGESGAHHEWEVVGGKLSRRGGGRQ